ncbi:hypothetical protein [Enterovirga sp. CN4-39]|uniref:hypothetical protein n=1 Tax=Enterovirga sp. CN4-39 TaxID=3400910 RepID=UPI003C12273F
MSGKGISRREFARLDGCSEALVRRGLTQGRLVAFNDGTIDPALVGTPWRDGNKGRVQAANSGAHDAQPLQDGPQLLSFAEAQTKKENYLAKLRELEFEIKSGRLVDAERVQSSVFDIARIERDAWINWPARVAPLIAAEIGVDQVKLAVALERHVREHLAERSEPRLRLAG